MPRLFHFAALCAGAAAVTNHSVIRNTTLGLVEGKSDGVVMTFSSIPFAAPPVGDLRFRAPQPATPWEGVRNVDPQPHWCPQLKLDNSVYFGNEDCLYLHVWAPENAGNTSLLPVLFWIFGGGYVIGDGVELGFYDGKNLAKDRNVVVISPNYRLGMFGFAALYSLQAEDADNSTGNAALQDQTAALRWAHDNAASFGGDPNRIHIFGESAGGFSIAWHTVSTTSAGLYASATMESGTTDATEFFTPLHDAVDFSTEFAASCGCNMTSQPELGSADPLLVCLRALPTEALMKSLPDALNPDWPFPPAENQRRSVAEIAQFYADLGIPKHLAPPQYLPALAPLMAWGPAIDGSPAGLRDMPLTLIEKGDFNKVPFMLGTNANEGSIFTPAMLLIVPNISIPLNDADVEKIFLHCLGAYNQTELRLQWPTVIAAYNDSSFNHDVWSLGSALITDFFFACSARRTARAMSSFGVPTYLYQFSFKISNWIEYPLLHDYHTSEIPFVFRNQWPPVIHDFDGDDWTMSDAMSAYWTNMAASGNPSVGPQNIPLMWPLYTNATDTNIQFALPFNTTVHLKQSRCDMWDGVLAALAANGGVVN